MGVKLYDIIITLPAEYLQSKKEVNDWKYTIDSHIYVLKHSKALSRILNTIFPGGKVLIY